MRCACLNNAPVSLEKDELGGERFECFNCKFKWRYIDVINSLCFKCDLHLEKNYCKICKIKYNHEAKKTLVYW
uniref:Uncharacterized protein n=1 Tax=viral metagenome TaxID=1070528 RepID=A0A6C0D5H6_9ZZZZ